MSTSVSDRMAESWSESGSVDPVSNGPGSIDPKSAHSRWPAALGVILAGVLVFLFGSRVPTLRAAWQQITSFLSVQGKPEPASPALLSEHESQDLDKQQPQKQAELLLERAINHYQGATDLIAARVDGWLGLVQLTPELNSLITTALNANDLRVRAAGIEIQLAASGIPKTPGSVDQLIQTAGSGGEGRTWALWTLGLAGNRGVDPERVSRVLVSYLNDPNEDVRHWAVEGLAHLGTDEIIAPLLEVLHSDPSPAVRERAACSLAQSGMLTQEQRRKAIPQLLAYADDPALDSITRGWVFQVLRDITGERLPDDSAAWRIWFATMQAEQKRD
jgi:hypothetical protein